MLSTCLYYTEILGGFILSAQASGIYYFIDNQTNQKSTLKVQRATKVFLGGYFILAIIRVVFFINIISFSYTNLPVEVPESNFGLFLGHLAENKGAQIIVTLFLMSLIAVCIILTVISLWYMSQVDKMEIESLNLNNKDDKGTNSAFWIGRSIDQSSINRSQAEHSETPHIEMKLSRLKSKQSSGNKDNEKGLELSSDE